MMRDDIDVRTERTLTSGPDVLPGVLRPPGVSLEDISSRTSME